MDFQFYPTPPALAGKMWRTFKNTDFERVLEPSAGDGALIKARPGGWDRFARNIAIDCCEIDVTKHPLLREAGANVVGMDFLQFSSGAIYSHVLLNPPFSDGDSHVLKAWDLLWEGEIVALVNAETLRNPFSHERRRLQKLVLEHGEVEYIEHAFMVPDAERKTPVDVAIIHLTKKADVQSDITGDLLKDLSEDKTGDSQFASDFDAQQQVAIPRAAIENLVIAFNAAVHAMRESVRAEAKAGYYEALLGDTMAQRSNGSGSDTPTNHTVSFVRSETAKRYAQLKDRAWASVLRSSNVTDRLSSSAQKRVESEFEQIKKLEFTLSNIYGFLLGLVESQGQLNLEMALHCFDEITRYHTDNTVFYRGWKSNNKHRTCGYRIKTSRFILPYFKAGYSEALDWDSMKRLADFDKVFAALDGKLQPEISLVKAVTANHSAVRHAERVSSSYFDIRFYKGVGSIHFYPRDKKLMERFNRLVGHHRQWIPPETEVVSKDFWLQYEKAEKFDADIRKEVAKDTGRSYWDNPLNALFRERGDERERAEEKMDRAMATVQERFGINVDRQLTDASPAHAKQLLLAA